jgi:glucokinase
MSFREVIMRYAIGIDLGGTKIDGGIVNENGEIVYKKSVDTSKDKFEVLGNIKNLATELSDKTVIDGIGIGSPGTIDCESGKVLTIGGNVNDWAGTDIKSYLKKFFPDKKIKVDNDANCAGLCEIWTGAAKGFDSSIVITLGTGLGGFLYYSGNVIRGSRYRAAELGHTILYPGGRECVCGQRGCTERYVSGTGIENNYEEFANRRISSIEVMERYEYDKNAKLAVLKFADDFSNFLVTCKNFFDPEIIVVGGGVINSYEIWWDNLLKSYRDKINSYDDMKIERAGCLDSAGIIGAASLILNE